MDLSSMTMTRQKSHEKKPIINYEIEMRMLGSGINKKPLKQSDIVVDNGEPRVNSQIQVQIESSTSNTVFEIL